MVKFPKHIFVTALIITVLVFISGLLLGYGIDSLRSADVLDGLRGSDLDTESYLVEQAFWETFGGEDCSFAEARLQSLSAQLTELGQHLNSYEEKRLFQGEEFEYIARRYFLSEIKAYTLFTELKEECGVEQDFILFFYESEDTISQTQGHVLDKIVRNSNDTVNIFSIDMNFEGDAAIETLKLYYGVDSAPTLIINGDVAKEGYTNYLEVEALLRGETVSSSL